MRCKYLFFVVSLCIVYMLNVCQPYASEQTVHSSSQTIVYFGTNVADSMIISKSATLNSTVDNTADPEICKACDVYVPVHAKGTIYNYGSVLTPKNGTGIFLATQEEFSIENFGSIFSNQHAIYATSKENTISLFNHTGAHIYAEESSIVIYNGKIINNGTIGTYQYTANAAPLITINKKGSIDNYGVLYAGNNNNKAILFGPQGSGNISLHTGSVIYGSIDGGIAQIVTLQLQGHGSLSSNINNIKDITVSANAGQSWETSGNISVQQDIAVVSGALAINDNVLSAQNLVLAKNTTLKGSGTVNGSIVNNGGTISIYAANATENKASFAELKIGGYGYQKSSTKTSTLIVRLGSSTNENDAIISNNSAGIFDFSSTQLLLKPLIKDGRQLITWDGDQKSTFTIIDAKNGTLLTPKEDVLQSLFFQAIGKKVGNTYKVTISKKDAIEDNAIFESKNLSSNAYELAHNLSQKYNQYKQQYSQYSNTDFSQNSTIRQEDKIINTLNMLLNAKSEDQLEKLIDSLTPVIYVSSGYFSLHSMVGFSQKLHNKTFNDNCQINIACLWITSDNDRVSFDGTTELKKLYGQIKNTSVGAVGGITYLPNEHFSFGAALSVTQEKTHFTQINHKTKATSYKGAIYGGWRTFKQNGQWSLVGSVSYGKDALTSTRVIDNVEKHTYHGKATILSTMASLKTGFKFPFAGLMYLEPYAQGTFGITRLPNITETSDTLADITVYRQTLKVTRAFLGIQASRHFRFMETSAFVNYARDFSPINHIVSYAVDQAKKTTAVFPGASKDTISYGAKVSIPLPGPFQLSLSYRGTLGSHSYKDSTFNFGIESEF